MKLTFIFLRKIFVFFFVEERYILWKAFRGINMREEGDISKRGDRGLFLKNEMTLIRSKGS